MGGYGSGRWFRDDSKAKTGSRPSIDIRQLKRLSQLVPGTKGILNWESQGVEVGSAAIQIEEDRLVLEYMYCPPEGDSQTVTQDIWFDHTACNFGGMRAWFSCPRCYRRAALIYAAGKRFLCRKCCNLSYKSQNWNKTDRLLHKAQKIRVQLGGSGDLAKAFPPKPKGMHFVTYCKLLQKAVKAERLFWRLIATDMEGRENAVSKA